MTDITELAQLKPGKYAILYRDNWDGEKNEYHTLAVLTEEGGWYDDEFNAELLKYQGDKILKVWPLDDGSNILALVEALEHYKSREERVTALVHDNSKSWDELYQQVEAKDKRNAELVEALEKAQQRIYELEGGRSHE